VSGRERDGRLGLPSRVDESADEKERGGEGGGRRMRWIEWREGESASEHFLRVTD